MSSSGAVLSNRDAFDVIMEKLGNDASVDDSILLYHIVAAFMKHREGLVFR